MTSLPLIASLKSLSHGDLGPHHMDFRETQSIPLKLAVRDFQTPRKPTHMKNRPKQTDGGGMRSEERQDFSGRRELKTKKYFDIPKGNEKRYYIRETRSGCHKKEWFQEQKQYLEL